MKTIDILISVSGQICPRDVEIENRLPVGFVLGMQEREGFGFVLGAEAELLAGGRVLAIINPCAPEQDESLLHN